jgi:hypothetical protein
MFLCQDECRASIFEGFTITSLNRFGTMAAAKAKMLFLHSEIDAC